MTGMGTVTDFMHFTDDLRITLVLSHSPHCIFADRALAT